MNLIFMATWSIHSEKIIDKNDFPYRFKKIMFGIETLVIT